MKKIFLFRGLKPGDLTIFCLENKKTNRCPIKDFLDNLNKDKPNEFKKLIRRIQFSGDRSNPPLNKELFKKEDGPIFAIRSNQIRIYCFFNEGNELLLTNGCIKKSRKANPEELNKAKEMYDQFFGTEAKK